MDRNAAQQFRTTWARDWNAHDLDQIMSHFAQDVVFRSPVAAQLLDACDEILSFDGGLVVAVMAPTVRCRPDRFRGTAEAVMVAH